MQEHGLERKGPALRLRLTHRLSCSFRRVRVVADGDPRVSLRAHMGWDSPCNMQLQNLEPPPMPPGSSRDGGWESCSRPIQYSSEFIKSTLPSIEAHFAWSTDTFVSSAGASAEMRFSKPSCMLSRPQSHAVSHPRSRPCFPMQQTLIEREKHPSETL